MLKAAVRAALSHNLKLQYCKYNPACIGFDGGALPAKQAVCSTGKRIKGGCPEEAKMNAVVKESSAFATAV